MGRGHTLERRLGVDSLIDISRRYFAREATNTEIASQYGFNRIYVPRLAQAGKALDTKQKAPSASTERG